MNDSRLFLCAPVNALVEGIYEQKIPFSEVKKHGDFGLGTFDNLDGEMVMLEGRIYQITADGLARRVDETTLTPFSCVTFYRPISHDRIEGEQDYDVFLESVKRLLPSSNICYAIRIDGEFACIKARSVPKQENYRPLAEVAKDQPVFHFSGIEGTLAGFFTPSFMGSLNVPGLHLHFLSADLQHGGHLLECRPKNISVGVQIIHTLELRLPISLDYLTWDFSRDITQDLDRAEK
ncbi:MAG: acetolactate decarboxylase [Deltaproteobacteria bacterium]|nr:acetolactate decarboxylase [Deltaproteobacteria bacterium]